MNTLGILGIVLAFALLMFLIMKNLNLYLTVFICVAVVIILNGLSPYETFKETYMTGFVGFFKNYFLLFLAGTVLAKFMDITNAARSIAQTTSAHSAFSRSLWKSGVKRIFPDVPFPVRSSSASRPLV